MELEQVLGSGPDPGSVLEQELGSVLGLERMAGPEPKVGLDWAQEVGLDWAQEAEEAGVEVEVPSENRVGLSLV